MTLSKSAIEDAVNYVHDVLTSDRYVLNISVDDFRLKCRELTDGFQTMAKHIEPLQDGEQAIVTLDRRKTAALLADRVWAADTETDYGISFGWEDPYEIRLRALLKLFEHIEPNTESPTYRETHVSQQDVISFLGVVERDLSARIHDATGVGVLPLFASSQRKDSQYSSGDKPALVSIVDNLRIVDEEELTWHQVVEFRQDKKAQRAYRRFVHWLDKDMCSMPISYVSDEVAMRLEQYEWALRKHGIKTLMGCVSSLLNPKSLISTSAAGLSVGMIAGDPLWSLLTSGGMLIGQVMLSLTSMFVERRDLEISHREIAYVQELKSRVGAGTTVD